MARKVAHGATATALRMVAGRETTEAKLRLKLLARGFDAAEVQAAVEQLKALRYVDDARATRSIIRAAIEAGKTPAWASQKLMNDGVAAATVERVLGEVLQEQPFDALAAAEALVRRRGVSGLRAARLLASRGFDEAVIRRVVPSIDAADGDG